MFFPSGVAAATVPAVKLVNGTSLVSTIDPSPAQSGYRLFDGKEWVRTGTGTWTETGGFYDESDNLEVRFSSYAGDALDGSSALLDTWLGLSTPRVWTLTQTGAGSKTGGGSIQVRVASGNTLDTVTCSLSSTVDPPE